MLFVPLEVSRWKLHGDALTWANWINFKAAFWTRHLSSPYDRTNTNDDSWCWCSNATSCKTNKKHTTPPVLLLKIDQQMQGGQASWMLLVGSNPNLGCERIEKSIRLMDETFSTSWVGSLSHDFPGFYPSQLVVWVFFHQQWMSKTLRSLCVGINTKNTVTSSDTSASCQHKTSQKVKIFRLRFCKTSPEKGSPGTIWEG